MEDTVIDQSFDEHTNQALEVVRVYRTKPRHRATRRAARQPLGIDGVIALACAVGTALALTVLILVWFLHN